MASSSMGKPPAWNAGRPSSATVRPSGFTPNESNVNGRELIRMHMLAHYKKLGTIKPGIDMTAPKSLSKAVKLNSKPRARLDYGAEASGLQRSASQASTRKTSSRPPTGMSTYAGGDSRMSSPSPAPRLDVATPDLSQRHFPVGTASGRASPTHSHHSHHSSLSRASRPRSPFEPSSSRPLSPHGQKQPGRLDYLKFVSEITSDILARGVFSDRAVDRICEQHITDHKADLDEAKMREMVKSLKRDLTVTHGIILADSVAASRAQSPMARSRQPSESAYSEKAPSEKGSFRGSEKAGSEKGSIRGTEKAASEKGSIRGSEKGATAALLAASAAEKRGDGSKPPSRKGSSASLAVEPVTIVKGDPMGESHTSMVSDVSSLADNEDLLLQSHSRDYDDVLKKVDELEEAASPRVRANDDGEEFPAHNATIASAHSEDEYGDDFEEEDKRSPSADNSDSDNDTAATAKRRSSSSEDEDASPVRGRPPVVVRRDGDQRIQSAKVRDDLEDDVDIVSAKPAQRRPKVSVPTDSEASEFESGHSRRREALAKRPSVHDLSDDDSDASSVRGRVPIGAASRKVSDAASDAGSQRGRGGDATKSVVGSTKGSDREDSASVRSVRNLDDVPVGPSRRSPFDDMPLPTSKKAKGDDGNASDVSGTSKASARSNATKKNVDTFDETPLPTTKKRDDDGNASDVSGISKASTRSKRVAADEKPPSFDETPIRPKDSAVADVSRKSSAASIRKAPAEEEGHVSDTSTRSAAVRKPSSLSVASSLPSSKKPASDPPSRKASPPSVKSLKHSSSASEHSDDDLDDSRSGAASDAAKDDEDDAF
eukprot:Opistho-2@29191